MSSKGLFEFKFCINCGVRLPKIAESCTNCGAVNAHLTKSSAVCANCGAKLPFRAVYCEKCGSPVDTAKIKDPVAVNPNIDSIVCKCLYCGKEIEIQFGTASVRCPHCDRIVFIDEVLSHQETDHHVHNDNAEKIDKPPEVSHNQFFNNNKQNAHQSIHHNIRQNLQQNIQNYDNKETSNSSVTDFSGVVKIACAVISALLIYFFSGGEEPKKDIPKEKAKPPVVTEIAPKPKSNIGTSQVVYLTYVGNSKSRVFHRENCGSVTKMKENNKVFFSTRDKAFNSGYKPCQRCNP